MADEVSKGGSKKFRHEARAAGPGAEADHAVAHSDDEALTAHIEKHIGKVTSVFHEIVSDKIHLDVGLVAPTDDDDAWTLFTSGMSARPMTLPAGVEAPARIELMMRLPASWPCGTEAELSKPENYWPVRWLKMLGRLPVDYDTWFGVGHTIPNGDPPQPFAPITKLACMMITPAVAFDADADTVTTQHGDVTFFSVLPLHPSEMQYKLDHGYDALVQKLIDAEVTDIFELERAPVV